jgi:ketosteroid isomerase-like protein
MDNRTAIISTFYSSFQKLNAAGMNACYADDIVFFDPAFGLLKGQQVKDMWEMLCKNAKDFSLTFDSITHLDDEYSTCNWTASYTFSKTGRKVVNKIKANMRFAGNRIIEHSDGFSLHKWSAQALGFTGWLLGWNRFFQRKIQNTARRQLLKYIEKKGL